MNEHETEPVRGLPERLPAGETILWQGAPRWGALARRVFHVRKIAFYFAILLAWLVYADIGDGIEPWSIARSSVWVIGGASVVIAILSILAWLIARSTVYTITSRRVVMRFGVAFPITFNFPFRRIRAAGLRRYADGSGDIPLALYADDRISYVVLWPHARPWRLANAEPMLRGLPNAGEVAELLAGALAAEMAIRTPVTPAASDTGASDTGASDTAATAKPSSQAAAE